jgi:hypothetical protein
MDGPDGPVSHIVLLAFCDAWRDEAGRRPIGAPLGWVLPVGEPLARLRVGCSGGVTIESVLRRRFEVNEGIIGWGAMAFLAVPHTVEGPLDWRGPHDRQGLGRRAEPGHAGPMGILPGAWGGDQTGVEDHVPSGSGDLTLWLHAVDVRAADGTPRRVRSIEFEPIAGAGDGRVVVLAAITAYAGSDNPLRWLPRRAFRVEGAAGRPMSLDLGLVARRAFPLDIPAPATVAGWGTDPPGAGADASRGPRADASGGPGADASIGQAPAVEIVELTAATDARLTVGDEVVALAHVTSEQGSTTSGDVHFVALPDASHRLEVSIRAHDGSPSAARVRVVARDGRSLPPRGHRTEVNPGIAEDSGAGVVLDGATYAYVESTFAVDVPREGAVIEVVRGPQVPPVTRSISASDVVAGALRIDLGPAVAPQVGRWVCGDTHVHFLAPSTALLQARAEGVNVVHLLATQWGDLHTSTTDLGGHLLSAEGDHAVWVGSENRQNLLGHVGLVGTPSAVLPFASGGPPEGPIGAPVTHLMADWLARCREQGGLAIGAHFPLPMAEIVADIEAGLIDALELQCFDETLKSPPIAEWYRYLDAGYRLPFVGGTDKMSAEVPLGQVRTWARLGDGEALTFEAWASALRAGRTFVSSGPIIELRVDGVEPGGTLELSARGTVEVEAIARAAQPIISGLEIVLDGQVVAAVGASGPPMGVAEGARAVSDLALREHVRVERSGWIAARSRSPYAIGSAFASVMAAHTSAVYLDVAGHPRRIADLDLPMTLVDGTRAWLETLAPVRDEAERRRFVEFLDGAERRLRERGRQAGDR